MQQPQPQVFTSTAMTYQQPHVVVPTSSQYPAVRNPSVTKGLGIAQILIGLVALILGIVVTTSLGSYWAANIGASIWGGIWILVTGILGVTSAANPTHSTLNGFHMTFCIISTIVAFIDGIFFIIATVYYSTCNDWYNYRYDYTYGQYYYRYNCRQSSLGTGLHASLLILMVVEFFVALIAAIYCCTGCCNSGQQGAIIVQQVPQPGMIIASSTYPTSGHTVVTPATGMYTQPQHPGMGYATMQPNTNVTYAQQVQGAHGYQQLPSQGYPPATAPQGYHTGPEGYAGAPPSYSVDQKQGMPPPAYSG